MALTSRSRPWHLTVVIVEEVDVEEDESMDEAKELSVREEKVYKEDEEEEDDDDDADEDEEEGELGMAFRILIFGSRSENGEI